MTARFRVFARLLLVPSRRQHRSITGRSSTAAPSLRVVRLGGPARTKMGSPARARAVRVVRLRPRRRRRRRRATSALSRYRSRPTERRQSDDLLSDLRPRGARSRGSPWARAAARSSSAAPPAAARTRTPRRRPRERDEARHAVREAGCESLTTRRDPHPANDAPGAPGCRAARRICSFFFKATRYRFVSLR